MEDAKMVTKIQIKCTYGQNLIDDFGILYVACPQPTPAYVEA